MMMYTVYRFNDAGGTRFSTATADRLLDGRVSVNESAVLCVHVHPTAPCAIGCDVRLS